METGKLIAVGKKQMHLVIRVVKGDFIPSKKVLIFFLFFLYLLPIFAFVYGCTLKQTLPIFSVGVFFFSWLLHLWEKKLQNEVHALVKSKIDQAKSDTISIEKQKEKIAVCEKKILNQQKELIERQSYYEHQIDLLHSSARKSKDKAEELSLMLERKADEVKELHFQFEDRKRENERLEEDTTRLRKEFEGKINQKERLLGEYNQTLHEQRQVIEKKQQQIVHLEGKVNQLIQEIHHLIKAESPSSSVEVLPLVDTHQIGIVHSDSSHHLKRYIEMAECLMGVEHLGGRSPRFLDMSDGNYHLDLRPLFEIFNDEETYIVFVYSPIEGRFLFVNHLVKRYLGWSPEKFAHHFPSLIRKNYAEWRKSVSSLVGAEEIKLKLFIQNRKEEEEPYECLCGRIAKGPFTGHLIGILIGPS